MNLKTSINTQSEAPAEGEMAAKEHKDHKVFGSMCSMSSFAAKVQGKFIGQTSSPRPSPPQDCGREGEIHKGSGLHSVAVRNRGISSERGVALVITLLMLAAITFLAIAFLSMTRRDKTAVTATLDIDTARSMSDAALSRAQAEIIAQMMATTDILNYDYMASHNYITPSALFTADFTGAGLTNSNNVNYDVLINLGHTPGGGDPQDWAQNIANLYFDPRPPVFVQINSSLTQPQYDFRYWVDIDRNGRFESNGWINTLDSTGTLTGFSNFYHGEPEWIGMLKYPEYVHSPTNPFIGRYAFMVLPIGKTLDLNYIHNSSKALAGGGTNGMYPNTYSRDEGVASWELNLAATLNDLSPAMYLTNQTTPYGLYSYGTAAASGNPFYDADQMLAYRYGDTYSSSYPYSFNYIFGTLPPTSQFAQYASTNVDMYGTGPSTSSPFDFVATTNPPGSPWPGTYNSNMFYDVQDLFDPNKTGQHFVSTLLGAVSSNLDTPNRYTFQRLLDSIGMSSAPEYGVYVYSNMVTNIGTNVPQPNWLRTKVNINYDNTAQIQQGPFQQTAAGPYGPFTPMPTNLQPWTPIGFFTNAADMLLRSQVFFYTNYLTNGAGMPTTNFLGQYVQLASPSNWVFETFGITNIPIYSLTNPSIRYNEQIHRLLQVAANIYAAAHPYYLGNGVEQPPIFRPQFLITTTNSSSILNVYITNLVQVTNSGVASNGFNQLSQTFYDLSDYNAYITWNNGLGDTKFNFWGIPWVVGAVKGLPAFDQYTYNNQVSFARQLVFVRTPGTTKVAYTNQFYIMSVSNLSGMDAWNPYASNYNAANGGLYVMASNFMTITLTNNYHFGTNVYSTNTTYTNTTCMFVTNIWPGGKFYSWLTNVSFAIPYSYFSETSNALVLFTNDFGFSSDLTQNTYPTHNWSVSVSNHLTYALFDGQPGSGGVLLDYVNLGPFGSIFPITQFLTNTTTSTYASMWSTVGTTDAGSPQPPLGILAQIGYGAVDPKFFPSLENLGSPSGYPVSESTFYSPGLAPAPGVQASPFVPFANYLDSNIWMTCDPLVHYTIGDLTSSATQSGLLASHISPLTLLEIAARMSNGLGAPTGRYLFGTGQLQGYTPPSIVLADPGMTSADAWQFPSGLFPTVGWIGRVHRGTPWQTIYLKADNPVAGSNWFTVVPPSQNPPWVYSPGGTNYPGNYTHPTYPTNDWSFADLFTTVPNDNAARGLLSVNQTNDPAWAAVLAGVIAIPNSSAAPATDQGVQINAYSDVTNLLGTTNGGINFSRFFNRNFLFHHIGDILQAPALTVDSPFLTGGGPVNDEMVERIPQQTLGLMKLGLPQFVIYAWGQSLKPKNLYSSGTGPLMNLCTNYEITGEYLTRTVCHVVSVDGTTGQPKFVIDNFNIEPGN
jgi:hypothetical protein